MRSKRSVEWYVCVIVVFEKLLPQLKSVKKWDVRRIVSTHQEAPDIHPSRHHCPH
jgi:hypothetical protein